MKAIEFYNMNDVFDCNETEAGELLTNYFKSRKHITGTVDIFSIPNIQSLYEVKRIDGDLIAVHNNMGDLGNLSVVHGSVEIGQQPLDSLGKLTYCAGLTVYDTQLEKIPRLGEINGNTKIGTSPLKDLGVLNLIGGNLKLLSLPNFEDMGRMSSVFGDVVINQCPNLKTLGSMISVGGSLDLRESDIFDFGKLNDIGGFVITKKSKMPDIPASLEVIDLEGLKIIKHNFPKCELVKIPKMDNLKDFGLIVIDDEYDKLPF